MPDLVHKPWIMYKGRRIYKVYRREGGRLVATGQYAVRTPKYVRRWTGRGPWDYYRNADAAKGAVDVIVESARERARTPRRRWL